MQKSKYLDTAFETINQGTAFTSGVMKRLQKVQCYKNEIQSKYYMRLHFKDS